MSDVFTPCALIGLLWFSAKAQEKMKYALKLQFHLGTLSKCEERVAFVVFPLFAGGLRSFSLL